MRVTKACLDSQFLWFLDSEIWTTTIISRVEKVTGTGTMTTPNSNKGCIVALAILNDKGFRPISRVRLNSIQRPKKVVKFYYLPTNELMGTRYSLRLASRKYLASPERYNWVRCVTSHITPTRHEWLRRSSDGNPHARGDGDENPPVTQRHVFKFSEVWQSYGQSRNITSVLFSVMHEIYIDSEATQLSLE